ncbi:META domain-containing protein [Croceicoccus sediminis]|uniref:META domain-containing protein n=1 Tax=Croceicoccus sediminis TaxID=2571150 RepID=UPI001478E13A|nr:META domain-containing protein [Croceicoccus sediminis]
MKLFMISGSIVAGLLAGCGTADTTASSPAGTPVAVPEDPIPVTNVTQVQGDWQVLSFDGYEPPLYVHPQPYAFASFAFNGGVGLRLECNSSGAAGKVADGRFNHPKGAGPQPQTVMSCGSEKNEREATYFAFFRKSPTMEIRPDGRLLMRAADSELLLARVEEVRLQTLPTMNEMAGPWRAEGLMKAQDGGTRGIGLSELAQRVVIGETSLALSGCDEASVETRYTEDGRLERTGGADAAEIRNACGELMGGHSMPGLSSTELADILAGSPTIYRSGKDRITMTSANLVLDLTREPCVMLNQSDDHSRIWEEPC